MNDPDFYTNPPWKRREETAKGSKTMKVLVGFVLGVVSMAVLVILLDVYKVPYKPPATAAVCSAYAELQKEGKSIKEFDEFCKR